MVVLQDHSGSTDSELEHELEHNVTDNQKNNSGNEVGERKTYSKQETPFG